MPELSWALAPQIREAQRPPSFAKAVFCLLLSFSRNCFRFHELLHVNLKARQPRACVQWKHTLKPPRLNSQGSEPIGLSRAACLNARSSLQACPTPLLKRLQIKNLHCKRPCTWFGRRTSILQTILFPGHYLQRFDLHGAIVARGLALEYGCKNTFFPAFILMVAALQLSQKKTVY